MLADYDADESRSAPLRDDLARMLEHLDYERDAGLIDGMMQRSVQGAMASVLRGLAYEHTNVMKGVEKMLEGQILDLDVFRIHDKAWDEGEAVGEARGEVKGRSAGRLEMLFDLVGEGQLTMKAASAAIKMPIADFERRMGEYKGANA